MFSVLYSDRLTRGQLLTHPKIHKMYYTNRVEMHIKLTLEK